MVDTAQALQILAGTIRQELEIRLESWRVERQTLMQAQARIAILDGLIAVAEDEMLQSLPVAPRPTEPSP